jgi:hypothetical protein
MTSTTAVNEPTAEQLRIIASLEGRARRAFLEIDEVTREIKELEARGLPGAKFLAFDIEQGEVSCIGTLRNLRLTGGRWGFCEWWHYRVNGSYRLKDSVEACGPEQARVLRALEKAVKSADSDLVDRLNAVAGNYYVHDDEEYERLAGMTRVEVEARAAAVITTLIESGWRP